jgi:bifunctional ADP-heptose synthase (sugar kinase/adenylyltransferase)
VSGFYLRIPDGRFGGLANHAMNLTDRDAAWDEMTLVCKDLVGSIVREIAQNTEWQMELLDESETPIYRIRVVAETLDGHLGGAAPASMADEVR